MTDTFDESAHPRQDEGRFAPKVQTAPEALIVETFVWVIEGDDREVEIVEAVTAAKRTKLQHRLSPTATTRSTTKTC